MNRPDRRGVLIGVGVCAALLSACVSPTPQLDRDFGRATVEAIAAQRVESGAPPEISLPQARGLLDEAAARRAPKAAEAPRSEGIASGR